MRFRIGTSGYAYDEWAPAFYPAEVPKSKRLRYYADRLDTVENNGTFRAMPTEKALLAAAKQVDADFTFALKAPQTITHRKRLKDAASDAAKLFEIAACLGPQLGPVLFQLPPNLKRDTQRLADFVAALPDGSRAAFEFRHTSWFDDEVYATLAARDLALAWSETDDIPEPPVLATASYGYLRLRRPLYDEPAMRQWIARARIQPWTEAYVYFVHDDLGLAPQYATRFRDLLDR